MGQQQQQLLCLVVWLICVHFVQTSFAQSQPNEVMIIKLVVYIDRELKHHLEKNLAIRGKNKLEQFILAYVKQVEANFSGLRSGTFDGIWFELIESPRLYEPDRLPSSSASSSASSVGDIDELLDEFCSYQWEARGEGDQRNNDSRPKLSLLLTALNLFSGEDVKELGSLAKSQSTMGISVIDGIHWPSLGCLIVEFGVNYNESLTMDSTTTTTVDDHDKHRGYGIYGGRYMNPSRGFGSTWVATHEIGHSLGIHHDGPPFNPECEEPSGGGGWIMSPDSLVESISLVWSKCSLDSINQLTTTSSTRRPPVKLEELPGQIFDLRAQCQTFAANLEVTLVKPIETICNKTVWCQLKVPNMSSFSNNKTNLVAIGPALEGTICDGNGSMICHERKCTPLHEFKRLYFHKT